MGKKVLIDHRPAPRSAGVPKILKGGVLEDAHPEPEVPTDEVVQLRAEVQTLRRELEKANQLADVKSAETTVLKRSLQAARDETAQAREEQQQPELEGHVPERIEIVTVDEIKRRGDIATMLALVDLDGTIGETQVVVPVDHIKDLIRKKKQNGQPNPTESVSPMRRTNEEDDVSDVTDIDATTR